MRSNGGWIGQMVRPTRAGAAGVWGMQEISANVKDTTWPTVTDPDFAKVTFLFHGDDQDGFVNPPLISNQHWRNMGSTTSKITPITGISTFVALDNATAQFGAISTKISGVGLGTDTGDTNAQFGTGDYVVEGWWNFSSITNCNFLDCRVTSSINAHVPLFFLTSAGAIGYFTNNVTRMQSANGFVSANTWYHVAAARISGNTNFYVAGGQVGSTFVDSNTYINQWVFMGSSNALGAMTGHLQEIRFTKGSGRGYTGASITVPTQKFPDTA